MKDMIKVVMSIVVVTIGLILFPTIIDQANTLYTAAGATYTGLQPLVQIAPVVIYVFLIMGAGLMGYSGVKGYRKRHRRASARH